MAPSLWSTAMPLELIEFPADDLARARRFGETLRDVSPDERREEEGQGLQTDPRRSLRLRSRVAFEQTGTFTAAVCSVTSCATKVKPPSGG